MRKTWFVLYDCKVCRFCGRGPVVSLFVCCPSHSMTSVFLMFCFLSCLLWHFLHLCPSVAAMLTVRDWWFDLDSINECAERTEKRWRMEFLHFKLNLTIWNEREIKRKGKKKKKKIFFFRERNTKIETNGEKEMELEKNKYKRKKNSRKSVRWSAVPVPRLSRLWLQLRGEQGSGPKGADDLCFHTWGNFSSFFFSFSVPP